MNSRQSNPSPRRQNGAALLAIMLVLIVTASYVLVSKLNSNVGRYTRQGASAEVLSEAKAALISYALRYPEDVNPDEGPGYLPCPDISNNGQAGGSCSLGGAVNTTIGRLPFKTLEISDLRDHAGERLWYAVSDNFKNNPKVLAALNTDSPGTLTLDGNSDIVAVIFAAGAPVGNQDRSDDPLDAANYLEDDNADDDVDFVTRAAATFNDQVIAITRQELMSVVEKRVLGDVRRALSAYQSTYNAYPWLSSFADPKASFQNLRSRHGGGNNSANLTDNTVDFTDWDVQPGDTVFNITDGSVGTVAGGGVSANTLTLSGLSLGDENLFDTDDEYVVVNHSNAGLLAGTATSGSNNLILNDTNKDFTEIGVSPGDIIDNLTDGSAGTVESLSATSVTVRELTGGADNAFAVGDGYRVRSNRGSHNGLDDSQDLTDSNADFVRMGIISGDLVINITDGSIGRVGVGGVSTDTLTMETMYLGTSNRFDNGDLYYIPRFNTDNSTRKGLLSIHDAGKHYKTGFSMDWSTLEADGADVSTDIVAKYPHPVYEADLENKVETSNGTTGTINVDIDNGQCLWITENIAECLGIYWDMNFPVQGTVTSGWNTSVLTDANADFIYTAVKQGDIVDNFDDEIYTGVSSTASTGSTGDILVDTGGIDFNAGIIPYYHFIHNISDNSARGIITEIIDGNTLRIEAPAGRPAMEVDPGDNYRIYYPQRMVVTSVSSATQLNTSRLTSAAPDFDSGGAGAGGAYQEFYQINVATGRTPTRTVDYDYGNYLIDAGADFSDIRPGDIVYNETDNAYGIITIVDDVNDYLYAQLYATDGSTRSFHAGETYHIYYNHDVNKRRYEFHTRYSGASNITSIGGVRKRDVCLGYNADCSALSGNVLLPEKDSLVVIKDIDVDGNVTGRAKADIPSGGSQGTIRLAGLDYYLTESVGELPPWFLKNKWHQLIYVAYSNGLIPGGANSCTSGTDCLVISGSFNSNDTEAIVLAAGRQLTNGICQLDSTFQDRANARVCDYFENNNQIPGDDTFTKNGASGTFNDKLLVVSPPLF